VPGRCAAAAAPAAPATPTAPAAPAAWRARLPQHHARVRAWRRCPAAAASTGLRSCPSRCHGRASGHVRRSESAATTGGQYRRPRRRACVRERPRGPTGAALNARRSRPPHRQTRSIGRQRRRVAAAPDDGQ